MIVMVLMEKFIKILFQRGIICCVVDDCLVNLMRYLVLLSSADVRRTIFHSDDYTGCGARCDIVHQLYALLPQTVEAMECSDTDNYTDCLFAHALFTR